MPQKKGLNSNQADLDKSQGILRPKEEVFFTKDINDLLKEFNKNLTSYDIRKESTMSKNIIWFANLIQTIATSAWAKIILPQALSDVSKYLTLAPILCKFFDLQNEINNVEIYAIIPSRNSADMVDIVFQQFSSQLLTMQHPAKDTSRKITSLDYFTWFDINNIKKNK
jgi:hypothetical protein